MKKLVKINEKNSEKLLKKVNEKLVKN